MTIIFMRKRGGMLNLQKSWPGPPSSPSTFSQCPVVNATPLLATGIGSPASIPSGSLASWARVAGSEGQGRRETRVRNSRGTPRPQTLDRAAALEGTPVAGLPERERPCVRGALRAPHLRDRYPCFLPLGSFWFHAPYLEPLDYPPPWTLDTPRPVHPIPEHSTFCASCVRKSPQPACSMPRTPHVLMPRLLGTLYAVHLAPLGTPSQDLGLLPSHCALQVFAHCLDAYADHPRGCIPPLSPGPQCSASGQAPWF